eukprot:CAMPEP_0178397374 /NCGR_PEP_ID=MMETSP0689_2-20121128/14211_1 /TAXON_ID=160604 /ORGANISM="Amphidinium massartii, Strain CS-259" /LENGTH=1438 /DNA_ID=CAMNT_0020018077 /DNA_START=47 /DNA_END=4363 /DNA_ORIENTATION=-
MVYFLQQPRLQQRFPPANASSTSQPAAENIPLPDFLRSCKPKWTPKDVQSAIGKLRMIGLHSVPDLARAVANPEDLNQRLKAAGQKAFTQETLAVFEEKLSASHTPAPPVAPADVSAARAAESAGAQKHQEQKPPSELALAFAARSRKQELAEEAADAAAPPASPRSGAAAAEALPKPPLTPSEPEVSSSSMPPHEEPPNAGNAEEEEQEEERKAASPKATTRQLLMDEEEDSEVEENKHAAGQEEGGEESASDPKPLTDHQTPEPVAPAKELPVPPAAPAAATAREETETALVLHGAQQQEEDEIPDMSTILAELNRQERDDDTVQLMVQAIGVDMEDIEPDESAKELAEAVEELDDMTADDLSQACYGSNLPVLIGQHDAARMRAMLRDALLWEKYTFSALQAECWRRGLQVADSEERKDVIQMLVARHWEEIGIPMQRLEDPSTAQDLLDRHREIEQLAKADLDQRCEEEEIPLEKGDTSNSMVAKLKRAATWEAMSAEELLQDCRYRGVLYVTPVATMPEHERKAHLVPALIDTLVGDHQAMHDLNVTRFGGQSVLKEVLEDLQFLTLRSKLALRCECVAAGLPATEKHPRHMLMQWLHESYIWKKLPLPGLARECQIRNRALPNRKTMLDHLTDKQIRHAQWEIRGIPVRLISEELANKLASNFKQIEAMPRVELEGWYASTGFPHEPDMEPGELVRLLKKVTVWFALPEVELQRECYARVLDLEQQEKLPGGLVDVLFNEAQMARWESKGWRARVLGDVKTLVTTVSHYSKFLEMDYGNVLQVYESIGLPSDPDLTISTIRYVLKMVMVWELLSAQDLERECREQGIDFSEVKGKDTVDSGVATKEEVETRRSELRFLLTIHACQSSWEKRGVPVSRLGIHSARLVIGQLERFATATADDLKELYVEYGFPASEEIAHPELLQRVRDITVWIGLPLPELWQECVDRDMDLRGFSLTALGGDKDVLRRQLVDRLLLLTCAERAQARTYALPAASAAALDDDAANLSEFPAARCYVETMRDAINAHRICGVVKVRQPYVEHLPSQARNWTPMEIALFSLSGGVFKPDQQRRERLDDETLRTRVAVVCPTNESRQPFHTLLYKCFIGQDYENKELVIVDTGKKPSPFFLDIVKKDSRVIYRHFYVEDSKEADKQAKAVGCSWTLGLKRNIACYLAQGAALAHFDDDDVYAPCYLTFMWQKLLSTAGCDITAPPATLPAAAAKLSDWHLLDLHSKSMNYLDVLLDASVPVHERRGWVFGWGFSYFFSRAAWELCPVPDVEFAEDAGFIEGLLARRVPIGLVRSPSRCFGLCAHTFHPGSTSGGEWDVRDGFKRCGQTVDIPMQFSALMDTVDAVQSILRVREGCPAVPEEARQPTLMDRVRAAAPPQHPRLGERFQAQLQQRQMAKAKLQPANVNRFRPQQTAPVMERRPLRFRPS